MAATVPQERASRQGGKRRSGRSCPAWFPAVACMVAGGDAVTGAATVILAMGAGKKAAAAIDEYLRNR